MGVLESQVVELSGIINITDTVKGVLTETLGKMRQLDQSSKS